MKKIFTELMAVAFAFSVVGFAVAAEKAAAPAAEKAATAVEKSAAVAEKSATDAKKAKPRLFTGTIESLDAAAGTLSVKGRKGNVDLRAGEKVKLGDFKIGDKVVVKHAEGTASSVKAVKAAKKTVPAPAAAPVKK
jgi:Cu/Ag efflux protein CusF